MKRYLADNWPYWAIGIAGGFVAITISEAMSLERAILIIYVWFMAYLANRLYALRRHNGD